MPLIAELKRRRIFRAFTIYAVAAWVAIQVGDIVAPRLGLPDWTVTLIIVLAGVGLPIALVLAWLYDVTPAGVERAPRTPAASRAPAYMGLGIIIALVGFGAYWRLAPHNETTSKTEENSVAVLPFIDMSAQKDQEYFGDGITEEILNGLSQIEGLRVPGRTSSFSFKGKELPIREIARQLGVANILEGSVRKAGDRVRITAQLIDARTDEHVWSQQYDRNLDDIFAVQGEIASAIVNALKLRMQPKAHEIVARETGSGIAHELYLKGLYFWNRRHVDELPLSIEYFQQAVREDSAYARAWAALALAYAVVPQYLPMDNRETVQLGKAAARRALQLDPKAADAHAALGQIAQEFDWDWAAAQQHLDAALALDPQSATVHQWRAELDIARGEPDKALAEIDRALAIEPLSSVMTNIKAVALRRAGRNDESIALLKTLQARDSGFSAVRENLTFSLFIARRYDELKQLYAGDERTLFFIDAVRDPARHRLGLQVLDTPETRQNMDPVQLAISYILLERFDSAAAVLDRAADKQWQAQLAYAVHEPICSPLSKYPAFQSFRRKVHL